MLDMGFLPDIRRVLRHLPARRQTLFFSATMPPPIVAAHARDAARPGHASTSSASRRRRSASPRRSTRCRRSSRRALLARAAPARTSMQDALVFTRTKHRANRLAEFLAKHGVKAERIHGNRSPGAADRGAGRLQEREVPGAGGHRHRRARDRRRGARPRRELRRAHRRPRTTSTGWAAPRAPRRPGDAFTFVAPEEEAELRSIERAIGRRLPRVTVPGFDYHAKPDGKLEIPLAERIAQIRAKKAEDRERSKAKAARREAHQAFEPGRPAARHADSAAGRRPPPQRGVRPGGDGRAGGGRSGGGRSGGGRSGGR